jgi:lipopolysaccharide transport system permease protein
MLIESKNLSQTGNLIWAWAGRIVRARYQQSALGWLWAIIQPATQVVILSVIFTLFLPVDTGDIPYPVFSYVGVVPWALLASSLNDMTGSLVQNMNMISKIYFPRETLPIAALLARLMDFGIAMVVLFFLMLIYKVPFSPLALLFLPVILAVQIILVTGLGFVTSALNVFYRDVQSFLTLFIQLWFYASPIIYPVSLVPENFSGLYLLNPMVGILEAYRSVLLEGNIPDFSLFVSAIVALVIFGVGYWFFKRVEFQFADIV